MTNDKEIRKNFRITNAEVELLKNTFKDNQNLLTAIEHTFLQIPLNIIELSLMKLNFNKDKEIKDILKRLILPELEDKNIYFGGTKDFLMGLEIKDVFFDVFVLRVKALKILEKYIKQQFKVIENGEYNKDQPIKFSDLAETKNALDSDIYINMFARNTIIAIVQTQLMFLYSIANAKEETPEQREERLKKNSAE